MKKIISIALALLMVAVMLPVMAMADEATVVKTKDELTAAVTKGGEVTLGDNITASITIPAGQTVTLNLGAFTLTGNGNHTITNNGTLTVVGTTGKVVNNVGSKGALFNNVGAIANLNGGTFEGNTWYVIKNLGTITMNGASVDQKDAGSSAIDNGWYDSTSKSGHGNDCGIVYPGGYAKLTIANGNFNGGMNTVKNDDYGVLEISGGTFSNTNGPTVLNWNVATISGGEFKVNSTATSVIANGSFNNDADKGQLTITGGKFNSADNGGGALLGYGDGAPNGGNLSITGGNFNGDLPGVGAYPYHIAITGGKFEDREGAANYIPSNMEIDGNGNVVNKSITIIVPSDGGNTTTTPSTDNTKNPSTGANDFVGVAAAMAVVSLLGAAAVIRKK